MELEVNGEKIDPPRRRRISVHELLTHLDVQLDNQSIEVEVNGDSIDRSAWLKEGAGEGDEVRITFTN